MQPQPTPLAAWPRLSRPASQPSHGQPSDSSAHPRAMAASALSPCTTPAHKNVRLRGKKNKVTGEKNYKRAVQARDMTAIESQARVIFASFCSDFSCQPAARLPGGQPVSQPPKQPSGRQAPAATQRLARYPQIMLHFIFFHGYGPEPYNAHSHLITY